MSRFTNVLVVSSYPDDKTWYLQSDFGYDVGAEDSGETINVPVGFTTDFASIPRLFWTILPKWGRYGNAAVIHDYLYYSQMYSRKRSDAIFLEAMGVLTVPGWKKLPIFWAVRFFGFTAWSSNKLKRSAGYVKIATQKPIKSTDMPEHWHMPRKDMYRTYAVRLSKRNTTVKGGSLKND